MIFKVGDRIKIVGYTHTGKTGKIVAIDNYSIGVRLDEKTEAHSCNGRCEDGHGWYVHKHELRKISNKKQSSKTIEGKTYSERPFGQFLKKHNLQDNIMNQKHEGLNDKRRVKYEDYIDMKGNIKPTIFSGKPKRDKPINKDEVNNLLILLNTETNFEKFLERVQYAK